MVRKIIFILPAFLLSGFLFAAADKSDLVITKCDSCHSIKKTCVSLGKKDSAAWEKTISRMIKKGAKVSEDEKKEIVEYLSGLEAGAKPICN